MSDEETAPQMSGQRKAAAIIFMLGEKLAGSVVRRLAPNEIRAISKEINNFPQLSVHDFMRAVERFEKDYKNTTFISTDARSQIEGIMQNALGKLHADSLLNSLEDRHEADDRLTGLQSVRPDALAAVIRKEQLQMQVAVLSCLNPIQAADVLQVMPDESQAEIIKRMACMDFLPKLALNRIAGFLEDFLKETHQETVISLQGQHLAADVLTQMEKSRVDSLIGYLQRSDADLAASVESKMFTFEHISRLTTDSIRKVVTKIDQRQLALSMKGMSEELQELIFSLMAKRAAEYLREDYESLGRVPLSTVNQARKDIRDHMLVMLQAGEITIKSKDDEMIE
ncbi:hypothetical protein M3P05_06255 [Sansalvadorimonas sp. 2012CJ34-2]|uniref:Flagellar motor switch protein FliG n=1 Tax=Parendozoicomonas callyspongiae TaxID=2942213 RepID=A0ABT0PFM1_9GAMM|nr:FliG C-terminal domain-containing protein [Sansalvadorimonas sp. 2012CJ34-2]MCL6269542.1 hypothetical protein [Sansalvadorimonas sp. 2012CJ34-2]